MMGDAHGMAPQRKGPTALTLVIVVVTSVFVVGIGVAVFVLLRPRGTAVGEMNLLDAKAALGVDAGANDTLSFRTDVSVSVALISTRDDDQRQKDIDAALRKSRVTVRATSAAGVERSSTCAIYKGRAVSSSSTPGKMSRGGMLNDCAIPIDTPGRWVVRASPVWADDLSIASATLEVRRETGSR